jgi:hypothetical protein
MKREPLFRSDRCAEEFKLNRIAQANGINELQLNKIATQEVVKVVQAHPGRYLLLSGVRFLRVWFHHRFVNFVIWRGPLPKAWLVALWNGLLLSLALLALLGSRLELSPSAVSLLVLISYSSLAYAATQAVGRYSVPLMPYVMVFAACAITQLFLSWRESRVTQPRRERIVIPT